MLAASFAEILSIGAVFPFLGVLSSPLHIFELPVLQPAIHLLGLSEPKQVILPATITFGVAILIASTIRLLLLWATTKLSYSTGADLSINIYRRTLYQPYEVHCGRNTSQVVNGIYGKTKGVIGVINMTLTLIGSAVILVTALLALFLISPLVVLLFCGFGAIYFLITKIVRKRLNVNSELIAFQSSQVIKSLQEGLGGVRDILIDGSQEAYCNIYQKADAVLRDSAGSNAFISASPRYFIECLGVLTISVIAYFFARQVDGISASVPMLGLLALGAQRLLPTMQQFYSSWTQIVGARASVRDVLELLDQPLPAYFSKTSIKPIEFKKSIILEGVSFSYNADRSSILNNINLTIPRGSRVGFIGATGSGKSTLLDIIMSLLHPTEGALLIDNCRIDFKNHLGWQAHIAHVPQTIFLTDSSVEENIAFGVPKNQIDSIGVRKAAEKAQIAQSIKSWPNGYQTSVGERGVKLSGGQRQRIGIARALYKKADVIILDEATSALDNQTEETVMQSIADLGNDLTILIVAHRLSSLRDCTHVVELEGGKIKRVGTYLEMIAI